jgi:hypothetical protein
MVDTQDVKSFDDAMNHVGRDIKAWYVLRHAIIDVVKASMNFPRNRKVLIAFIMSHRNMDLIINKSKKVQNFAERLIKSTAGGINEAFDNRWGKIIGTWMYLGREKIQGKNGKNSCLRYTSSPIPARTMCFVALHPPAVYGAAAIITL